MNLRKATGWLLGVIGAALTVMAQVSYSTAKSNVAGWVQGVNADFAASLPANIDFWTTFAGLVTFLLGLLTILLWHQTRTVSKGLDDIMNQTDALGDRIQVLQNLTSRGEYLTLKDAAQYVYDETRHSVLSQIARDEKISGEDDPRIFVANTILSKTEKLEGKVKGSTRYDPIPMEDRGRLWTDKNLSDAGAMYQPAKYYSIRVKQKDLAGVIDYFKRSSQAF